MSDTAVIYRSFEMLHHKAKPAFVSLMEALRAAHKSGRSKRRFELFEGFRDPIRQGNLLKAGATKAAAFQSAHQYGLACDFVPKDAGPKRDQWSWIISEDEITIFHALVADHGLQAPIKWDPLHVEHPLWNKIKKAVV